MKKKIVGVGLAIMMLGLTACNANNESNIGIVEDNSIGMEDREEQTIRIETSELNLNPSENFIEYSLYDKGENYSCKIMIPDGKVYDNDKHAVLFDRYTWGYDSQSTEHIFDSTRDEIDYAYYTINYSNYEDESIKHTNGSLRTIVELRLQDIYSDDDMYEMHIEKAKQTYSDSNRDKSGDDITTGKIGKDYFGACTSHESRDSISINMNWETSISKLIDDEHMITIRVLPSARIGISDLNEAEIEEIKSAIKNEMQIMQNNILGVYGLQEEGIEIQKANIIDRSKV